MRRWSASKRDIRWGAIPRYFRRKNPLLRRAQVAERFLDSLELAYARAYKGEEAVPAHYEANGWLKCFAYSGCTIQPTHKFTANSSTCVAASDACLHLQAVSATLWPATAEFTSIGNNRITFVGNYQPDINRWTYVSMWVDQNNANAPGPVWVPAAAAVPAAWIRVSPALRWPSIDAFSLPIGQFVPTPQPVPYKVAAKLGTNPYRAPSERSVRGHDVAPATATDGGSTFVIDRSGVRTVTPDPAHRPPGRRVKERKFVMAINNRSTFGRVLGATGELGDWIEVLHKALPREFQAPRGSGALAQARAVYQHFDKVDMQKVVVGAISNEVEDRVFGRIGRHIARANRRAGFSVGFATGPAM